MCPLVLRCIINRYSLRFTLRKESASTTGLTEYLINNSILPFTVAIVDTPGLVNEKGYKGTSGIIKEWFEEVGSKTIHRSFFAFLKHQVLKVEYALEEYLKKEGLLVHL